jgi:uncharacterized membrane protein HdeD (DUF308 family)
MSTPARPRTGEGWLLFSAIILITGGVIRIFDAFWAFDKDDDLAGDVQAVVFNEDLTAYGWLWLIMGILMIAAGFGVLSGAQWARWFGIIVASLTAITAMFWIYAYPIWALVFILISFLVIYGLATYGGSTDDVY